MAQSSGQLLARVIAFNTLIVNDSQARIDELVAMGYDEDSDELGKAIQVNKDASNAIAEAKWTASL